MKIDNNHLVTRYFDLQAMNGPVFAAVDAYLTQQISELYDQLQTHFVDTVRIDIDAAVQVAKDAGLAIDPAEAEIAVTNYILKTLDALGLLVVPLRDSDPNTIVAHLNFFNHSRYY